MDIIYIIRVVDESDFEIANRAFQNEKDAYETAINYMQKALVDLRRDEGIKTSKIDKLVDSGHYEEALEEYHELYNNNNNLTNFTFIDIIKTKLEGGNVAVDKQASCKDCGGTGIIDCGFYKRDCNCQLKSS